MPFFRQAEMLLCLALLYWYAPLLIDAKPTRIEGDTSGPTGNDSATLPKPQRKRIHLPSAPSPFSLQSPCSDVKSKFQTKNPKTDRWMQRSCLWVRKKNTRWRCRNFTNVAENCPVTCGTCNPTASSSASLIPIPSPSNSPHASNTPTNSNAPSMEYQWCHDQTTKFSIDTVKWIRREKTCSWATKKQWFRCEIEEVQFNCPRTCNFCQCIDNLAPFSIQSSSIPSRQKMKTCKWPKRKDLWWRCNHYPEVKRNCPNTCGECTTFNYPSDYPSASPTVKVYPTIITTVSTTFEMTGLEIPEDKNELEILKADIATAYQPFVPLGAVITDVTLIAVPIDAGSSSRISPEDDATRIYSNNITARKKRNSSTTDVTITTQSETTCTSDECDEGQEEAQRFIDNSKKNAENATSNNALANNIKIETGNDAVGIGASAKVDAKTEVIESTRRPTGMPSKLPTSKPSQSLSMHPSQSISSKPSMLASAQPTEKSDNPSKSPTGKPITSPPTKYPTPEKSSKPSQLPSSYPTSYDSSSPSSNQFVNNDEFSFSYFNSYSFDFSYSYSFV